MNLNNKPKSSVVYTTIKNTDNQLILGTKDGLSIQNNANTRKNAIFKTPVISSRKSQLRSEAKAKHAEIYTLASQDDGKLLIGGVFGFVNGKARDSIARLKKDGTLDENFLNTDSGANGEINDIKIASNGEIFVGGYFTLFNDINTSGLVALNNQGEVIKTSDSLEQQFKLSVVNDIEFSDDIIILGGFFVDENEVESGIVVLNSYDLSINESKTKAFQVEGQVFNTYFINDLIYIVGNFKKEVFGEVKENIIVFNKEGSISNVNRILPHINGYIYDIVFHNNETYIVGNFVLDDLLNQNILIFDKKGQMTSNSYSSEKTIHSIFVDNNKIYFATTDGLVEKDDLKDML